ARQDSQTLIRIIPGAAPIFGLTRRRLPPDQLADLLPVCICLWDGWAHVGSWGPAGPLHAGGGLRLVRSAGLGLVLVEGSAGSGPGRAAGGDLPEGGCNCASPSGDGEGAAGGVPAAPSAAFQIKDPGAAVSRGGS